MNKFDFFIGSFIGFLGTIVGCYIFISLFTQYNFMNGIEVLKLQGSLGKLITLGSILNLIIFSILLKMRKEMMARGVILAVILITIYTVFI